MINRISEIPLWGPEEQIRNFIAKNDGADIVDFALENFFKQNPDVEQHEGWKDKSAQEKQTLFKELVISTAPDSDMTDLQKDDYYERNKGQYCGSQEAIT